MFTLCIRPTAMTLLFFWVLLPQVAAADCAPNALSSQGSSGSCNSGNQPLSSNQTGTSFSPCGINAPPLAGVYAPSTGNGSGVYDASTGAQNSGVYDASTGAGNGDPYSPTSSLAPSGLSGGVGALGCPIGVSGSALRNVPINPGGRRTGTRNPNFIHTETPATETPANNNRTNNTRTSTASNVSNKSTRFHGVRANHAHI
jgi:hypothetical protein